MSLESVSVHELSRTDARRIAVRAQLLDNARPAGVLDVVRHLTLLQNDPTATVAPSADLVLWSRLGSAYEPDELQEALERQQLIELHSGGSTPSSSAGRSEGVPRCCPRWTGWCTTGSG